MGYISYIWDIYMIYIGHIYDIYIYGTYIYIGEVKYMLK